MNESVSFIQECSIKWVSHGDNLNNVVQFWSRKDSALKERATYLIELWIVSEYKINIKELEKLSVYERTKLNRPF